jgi:hypothetical protein
MGLGMEKNLPIKVDLMVPSNTVHTLMNKIMWLDLGYKRDRQRVLYEKNY